jgi:DNA-binding NarL/FixJ family response regulator
MNESPIPDNFISVLFVDDHLFIRNSFQKLLQTFNFVGKIELAESGEEAIIKLKNEHFDIVLMDNSMPKGMLGVDATYWITQNLPDIKVIGITNIETGNTGVEFFVKGAKGFFEKGFASEFLDKAILTVYYGGTFYSEDVQEKIIYNKLGIEHYKRVELDEREYFIIECLSNALSTKYIADKLNLKVRRVEQIISEIHSKTGCKTPFQLAMYLTRNKYLKS